MNKSILSISLDSNIIDPKYGNSQERQKEYAKYFENYTIIILNNQKSILKKEIHFKNLHIYSLNSKNRYFYLFDALQLIKKISKIYRFDLVSSQDPLITGLIAYLVKLIYKIPFNLQIHSTYCFDKNQKYNLFLTLFIKFITSKADSIRTVATNLIIKEKLVKHIPVMVDLSFYYKKPELKTEIKSFISVGRLSNEKNFPLLINLFSEIIKKYPKLVINIVGDGSEKNNLKKLIIKNNAVNNIKLLGFKIKEELKKIYHQSDVFILLSNYEGWGNVFLEAISAGLPIISTNVGFPKYYLIDNKSVLIYKSNNPNDLENKILSLFNNPKLAVKLAQNSQIIIRKFSKQKLLNDWINLLQNTK